MQETEPQTTAPPTGGNDPEFEPPQGNHALEIAARAGFGPLSPMSRKVWHGDALPCVSCGQLVHRTHAQCDHCGQDLREEMIEKMRAHSGPWFVLEHLRPFPGVSLDRIIRQIRRGLITETSIVRGPATDYHWRFAVETPGLCRYFSRCWHCHHDVKPSDSFCAACLSNLSFETPLDPLRVAGASARTSPEPQTVSERITATMAANTRAMSAESNVAPPLVGGAVFAAAPGSANVPRPPTIDPTSELSRLASAVRGFEVIPAALDPNAPLRIGPFRATSVALAVLLISIGTLLLIVRSRTSSLPPASPSQPTSVQPG